MDKLFELFFNILSMCCPVLFAAMGGLICERSGVVALCLEGLMLIGAFFAAASAYFCQSSIYGLLGGIFASIAFSLLFGVFVLDFYTNQMVTGIAINLLCTGLTPFLSRLFFSSAAATPTLSVSLRMQGSLLWICFGFFIFTHWLLNYSLYGLWLKFAGQNPQALLSAGISTKKIRYIAIMFMGLACGLAGTSLSMFLSCGFTRNMSAGKGFIAIAAIVFGKWKPIPTAFACFFFGVTDFLQMQLQGASLWGYNIPVQFVQMIPYIITLMILGGFVGRTRAPRALGKKI